MFDETIPEKNKTRQPIHYVWTFLTDTPVCELLASGRVSGVTLTLGGLVWPLPVFTLDNVIMSDLMVG